MIIMIMIRMIVVVVVAAVVAVIVVVVMTTTTTTTTATMILKVAIQDLLTVYSLCHDLFRACTLTWQQHSTGITRNMHNTVQSHDVKDSSTANQNRVELTFFILIFLKLCLIFVSN